MSPSSGTRSCRVLEARGPSALIQNLPSAEPPAFAMIVTARIARSRQPGRGLAWPPALVEQRGQGPGTAFRGLAPRRGSPAHDVRACPGIGVLKLALQDGPKAWALLQAGGQHGPIMIDHGGLPIILALLVVVGPIDQLQEGQYQHGQMMPITVAQALDFLRYMFDIEVIPRVRPDRGGLGLRPGIEIGVIVWGGHRCRPLAPDLSGVLPIGLAAVAHPENDHRLARRGLGEANAPVPYPKSPLPRPSLQAPHITLAGIDQAIDRLANALADLGIDAPQIALSGRRPLKGAAYGPGVATGWRRKSCRLAQAPRGPPARPGVPRRSWVRRPRARSTGHGALGPPCRADRRETAQRRATRTRAIPQSIDATWFCRS